MKINIPTKITIARILLIGLMIVAWFVLWIVNLATGWTSPELGDSGISLVYLIFCIVFVVASLTDSLDGYLARKWKQVTDLGKFLDPIADKMLVNATMIFIAVSWQFAPGQVASEQHGIIAFCLILMVLRDLIVDTMRFVAASKGVVVAANIFGKLKTIFQMVAIPFVLLNGWPFSYFDSSWGYGRICLILLYLATAMSVVSGIIYVYQGRGVFLGEEKKDESAS
ncbi:MAG: CDP-diacylglycerol--glycerol-3-phosphate 3-phosphatidyltransferase [Bacillota bacterium]|nr:CDP-diacylglycerol--glycerol-3-phosphate 3-phosphatidyltransferase [Bacillota bacterium]